MSETLDVTEWEDGRISRRLSELSEINKPWQCHERKQQIERQINMIGFEATYRYAQDKDKQIEEAWSEHNV